MLDQGWNHLLFSRQFYAWPGRGDYTTTRQPAICGGTMPWPRCKKLQAPRKIGAP